MIGAYEAIRLFMACVTGAVLMVGLSVAFVGTVLPSQRAAPSHQSSVPELHRDVDRIEERLAKGELSLAEHVEWAAVQRLEIERRQSEINVHIAVIQSEASQIKTLVVGCALALFGLLVETVFRWRRDRNGAAP